MKKPSRQVQFRRAKKRCHELWSLRVRERDGHACVMCGRKKYLQAHHWIVHARGSVLTRFLLENGVTLCYVCHIHKVHQEGGAEHIDKLRAYMMPRFLGELQYAEIKAAGNTPHKLTLEDLLQVEARLKALSPAKEKSVSVIDREDYT